MSAPTAARKASDEELLKVGAAGPNMSMTPPAIAPSTTPVAMNATMFTDRRGDRPVPRGAEGVWLILLPYYLRHQRAW